MSDHVSIGAYYGRKKYTLMNALEKTLDDANIQMDQHILVEVRADAHNIGNGECVSFVQENGSIEKVSTSLMVEPSKSILSVAEGLSTSKKVSRSCSSEQAQTHYMASPVCDLDILHVTNCITKRGTFVGLTGLQNLGNTCFMNSAIQCLVHTPEFATYFSKDYHEDINWQNPLGMAGGLALAFGDLLRNLRAPGCGVVSPGPFKDELCRFAPQFSGYSQHDSQELLAFLLDGLHEDLNRVRHKPYINSKDADGRPDEEVADEYWTNHIARNDSIIVDVFQGQYKSTLICSVCNKISVTFDPFMYLSLPLQPLSTRSMNVLVFTCDGSAPPTLCTVTVPKQGRLKELVQALSNSSSLKIGEKLLIAEICDHSINQVLDDPCLLLSTIKDDDHLAAYKFPKVAKSTVTLQFVHRREKAEFGNIIRSKVWRPFGIPFVASIPCNGSIKREVLQGIVHKMLNPMLHPEERPPSGANQATSTSKAIDSTDCDVQDQEQDTFTSTEAAKQQLQLFDENGECIDISAGEDKVIHLPSSPRLIFINWSEKDLKKYDTHCMENLPEVYKYASAPKRGRSETLSLYACMDAFVREELLVPEDMWYCPRCKERRQASKKLDLWRLPEVLMIHLKRFSFSGSTKHKLETFVNFPIHDFDLTDYVARKDSPHRQLYELYALSNHCGGMHRGHYTAFIKLLDENKWYNFDDNRVYPMSEKDVKSDAAYVLFYRRVK